MPVIIPRLADLEQAACNALPSVLARAVSAASARSPLIRVYTAPPGLSNVWSRPVRSVLYSACFIQPAVGNHKRMTVKLNIAETRLCQLHGTAARPSGLAFPFSLLLYVVC